MTLTCGSSLAEVDLPALDSSRPVSITAHSAMTWQQGTYQVWVLDGGCQLTQGHTTARAKNAVVWIDHSETFENGTFENGAFANRPHRVIVYFEGEVVVEQSRANGWQSTGQSAGQIAGQSAGQSDSESPSRLTDTTYLMRLTSHTMPDIRAKRVSGAPDQMPAIYNRGMAHRNPLSQNAIRRTQFTQPISQPGDLQSGMQQPQFGQSLPSGMRRISINSRSAVDFQTDWRPDQNLVIITSGVNVVVEGMA